MEGRHTITTSGKRKHLYFFIFIIPALFFYTLFFIFPFLNGVRYTFTDWKGGGRAEFIGLNNFSEMFTTASDRRFLPSIYPVHLFEDNYELPFSIDTSAYREMLVDHIKNPEELAKLGYAFEKQCNGKYVLNENLDEFVLFDSLTAISGMDNGRITAILAGVKEAAYGKKIIDTAKYEKYIGVYDNNGRTTLTGILQNYYKVYEVKKILGEYMYRNEVKPGVIGFTLLYTAINLVCANIIALLLALALDRKLRLSKILRTIFFLPNALSLITLSFAWSFLFDKVLPAATGMEIWLSNPQVAPLLVSFIGVWRSCGFMMLIYTAGLQCIPREYLEAADMDGANALQKLIRITGPFLIPAFTACTFWSLADSLKLFDFVLGITGTSNYVNNIVPLVLDFYIDAMKRGRFGYAIAKALLLCLAVSAINAVRLGIMKKWRPGNE